MMHVLCHNLHDLSIQLSLRTSVSRNHVLGLGRVCVFNVTVECFFGCAAILNELLQRENRVLHFWTLKKRRLDQCQQYLVFERSAKQVGVLVH